MTDITRFIIYIKIFTIDQSAVSQYSINRLEAAKAMFEDLGYDVIELPCGKVASHNYTNSIMFTPEGSQITTVLVPQYGRSKYQDAEALRAYESRGFNVVPVDMSTIPDDAGAGSLHCSVETLA